MAAALGATLLLERCKPDVIVNTGSAGGLAPTLKVGDIVVSDERAYTMPTSPRLATNTVNSRAARQGLKLTTN